MNLRTLLDDAILKPLHMDTNEHQIVEEVKDMPAEANIQDEPSAANDAGVLAKETVANVDSTFGVTQTQQQVNPLFNCPDCLGEGLVVNGNLCLRCNGTGKGLY